MSEHLWPGATYRQTGSLRTDPQIVPVGVIWHLSAGESVSLYHWFHRLSGGIESHLHVPRTAAHPTEQYRPGNREADANYRGNSWLEGANRLGFQSMEFQGTDVEHGLWTPHQVEQGLAFCWWSQQTYGWEPRVARHYRDRGIGYHTMWGSGPDTLSWSNARGKTCPGRGRIAQFHDEIVPRFLAGPPSLFVPFLTEAGYMLPPTIRRGTTDTKWVRKLQCSLLAHGHDFTTTPRQPNSVDGDFGGFTEDRLKVHQAAHGLPATGVADDLTWRTLIER